MAQRAIRRDVEPILTLPPSRPAAAADWRRLGAGWIVLPAAALPGLPGSISPDDRRFVLLHPTRGVTVLDLFQAAARPRPGWLEAELLLAGFLRRFDPRLPVHRIHLAEPELPQLHGVLARAFARSEPLDLPGGDAWMGAVQATLAASPLQAGAARRRPAGRRGRRYRRAAAALLLAGAAAALPGDAARLTAPEPGPGPAAMAAPSLPQVARVDPPPLPAPPPVPSGGRLARLQPPPAPDEALPLPPIPPPATTAGLDPLPLPTAPRLPSFATLAALPAPMPVPVPEASPPAARSEERRPAPRSGARVATPRRVPGRSSDTDTIGNATPRCRDIVLRVQLGEELSHADRGYLRSGCGQRP